MSLADYLAKNYLTAEGPTKKKKRKRDTNLNVIDASETFVPPRQSTNQFGDDEDLADAQVVGDVIEDRGPSIPREKRWKPAIKEEEEERPDELPTLEMDTETERAVMSPGARAGLQTGAEVAAAIKKKQEKEMEEFKKSKLTGKESETVYRDATGRRIDPMLRRAEARYQQEK